MHRLPLPCAIRIEDLTRRSERLQHLFDEKGVALGQRVNYVQELAAQRTLEIEYSAHHEVYVVDRQGIEAHLHGEALAVKSGQEVGEGARLVAAISDKE